MLMRFATVAAAALLAAGAMQNPAQAQTTINVATAGDQNMVDYIKDYLGPLFEKTHPGVKVVAVGTGPGDAGSQKIYEKLAAQKAANVGAWDFDVIVVAPEDGGPDGDRRPARRSIATRSTPASW